MLIISVFLGLLLGSALTIFALENATVITVTALSMQFSAPLGFLLMGIAALGAVASLVAFLPAVVKSDKRVAQLEQEKRVLENELDKYRIVIPVAPFAEASPIRVEPREREIVLPR